MYGHIPEPVCGSADVQDPSNSSACRYEERPNPLMRERVSPVWVPSYDRALMRKKSHASPRESRWSPRKSREVPLSSVKFCAMLMHSRARSPMRIPCESSRKSRVIMGTHTREKCRVSTGKCEAPSWWVLVFEGKYTYLWSAFFFFPDGSHWCLYSWSGGVMTVASGERMDRAVKS